MGVGHGRGRGIVGAGAQHLQRRRGAARPAQSGGHYRDAHVFAQRVVISGTVDHMRFGRSIGANGVHRQLGFAQFERAFGCGDQHQHAFGARQVYAFEQRAGHGLLSSNACAVRAFGQGGAHHGFAGLAHHGAYVFKVHVHMAGHVDDLGNAAYGVFQHVVGIGKSLILADIVAQHFEQFFVEHHDQRIDIGF